MYFCILGEVYSPAKNWSSYLSPAAALSSINKRSLKVSNSSKWVFLWFIPLGMKSELKEPKGKFSLSLATRVHASFAANRNAYFWLGCCSKQLKSYFKLSWLDVIFTFENCLLKIWTKKSKTQRNGTQQPHFSVLPRGKGRNYWV